MSFLDIIVSILHSPVAFSSLFHLTALLIALCFLVGLVLLMQRKSREKEPMRYKWEALFAMKFSEKQPILDFSLSPLPLKKFVLLLLLSFVVALFIFLSLFSLFHVVSSFILLYFPFLLLGCIHFFALAFVSQFILQRRAIKN